MGTSHSWFLLIKYFLQRSVYIGVNELAYFSDKDPITLIKSIKEMKACERIFGSWAEKLAE